MCSYNIIWRVSQKRAWSKDTVTMSTNMVFKTVDRGNSNDPTSTTLSIRESPIIQQSTLDSSLSDAEEGFNIMLKDESIISPSGEIVNKEQ